jgi:outer membrane biogenesis lipoprotein LolB
MKDWRLRLALGIVSAFLAACGDRTGQPNGIALGHGAHLCMSVAQMLTACIGVTQRDTPGRHSEATAADTQACPRVQALNRVDASV